MIHSFLTSEYYKVIKKLIFIRHYIKIFSNKHFLLAVNFYCLFIFSTFIICQKLNSHIWSAINPINTFDEIILGHNLHCIHATLTRNHNSKASPIKYVLIFFIERCVYNSIFFQRMNLVYVYLKWQGYRIWKLKIENFGCSNL